MRFGHTDRHRANEPTLTQNIICDGLSNAFDQLKPALCDQVSKSAGQFPIVDRVGDLIASRRRLRINLQLEIDDQRLSGFPFPWVDANDGLNRQSVDRQAVHQDGDANSVIGQRGLTTTA